MANQEFKKLFEPVTLGPIEIKNRIAVPPMNVAFQDPRGFITEDTLCYYAARARGGFGVIVTEAISTNELCSQTSQYYNSKLYDPDHVFGWRKVVEAVHAFDSRIIAQLLPGCGRQGFDVRGKVQSVAPSPIPYRTDPSKLPKGFEKDPIFMSHLEGQVPREITVAEIWQIIEAFYTSTKLAIRAGFDGVELHACHGYLSHEFLSPNMNKRTDEWGGNLENRMRFVVEGFKQIMRAVKEEGVQDKFMVGCRTSAAEYTEGGFTMEDMAQLHKTLEKLGSCYVDLSDGAGYEELNRFFPSKDDMPHKEKIAKFFTDHMDIPVMITSLNEPELAERVATESEGTIIGLGRQSIADPEWPNKVKEGRVEEIVRCIRCNQGCLLQYGLAYQVQSRCMVNPNMGREKYEMENWPPPMKKSKKYLR